MINFNSKLNDIILKSSLVKEGKVFQKISGLDENEMQMVDELNLILMLRGKDIPLFNSEGNKIGIIEFCKSYSGFTKEKRNRLLKIVLRKTESSYILNNCKHGKYPTVTCQQQIENVAPVGELIDGEIPYTKVSTKFNFIDNFHRYIMFSFEGPTIDYKPSANGKILSKGDILSEFELSALDFQEAYFRMNDDEVQLYSRYYGMPHLKEDRSNIEEILEYWKNIPIEERKDWEPDSEYSMFGGDESRKLAYGDKIVTGPITPSINDDFEESKPEPDKIYKPYTVKVEQGKCTSRWIPSQNLKVGK